MVMLTGRERVGTRYESYRVEKVLNGSTDAEKDDVNVSMSYRKQTVPYGMPLDF